MNESIEIERKWVIARPPNIELHKPEAIYEIEQAYLAIKGLRLRKKNEVYLVTYKGKGDLSRSEWEQEIPAWTYDGLKTNAIATLHKTRTVFRDGQQLLELDTYHANLAGLYTVEAEWVVEIEHSLNPSARKKLIKEAEKLASAYKLPSWLEHSREVTGQDGYKNRALAELGLPEEP